MHSCALTETGDRGWCASNAAEALHMAEDHIADLDNVEGDNCELVDKIDDLEKEIESLKKDIADVEGANCELVDKIADLEKEIETLKENRELSAALDDLAKASDEIKELEKVEANLRSDLAEALDHVWFNRRDSE